MITKKSNSVEDSDFTSGEVILIDKHAGVSSFYIVKVIRGITKVKKVGHAGTLDPNATGLLVVCTGKKTKEIYKFQDAQKVYSGTMVLGQRTASMDSEAEVIEEKPINHVDSYLIASKIPQFVGTIKQVPPMFSALKHKGKPLYKYARNGVDVKREPREVTISSFEVTDIEMPRIKFRVNCSKGTYVRVLADDFGKALGTVAFLETLRREAIGQLNVIDALSLEEFETLYKSRINLEM